MTRSEYSHEEMAGGLADHEDGRSHYSEGGVKGVRKPQNRAEKVTKTANRVELYQNTETGVTNVGVVLSSILEVHHSITNMTLCIPITAEPPPRFAPQRFFALYPHERACSQAK